MSIAARLASPTPTWTKRVDVIVVGSGVAGLTVALAASRVATVLIVTKAALDAGSTSWAQGGIAAVVDVGDTPAEHLADTLVAGAGLCSERAVTILVEEGPKELARLISLGMKLDTDESGALSLTREGGHGRNRIVHAGGDATGAEVQRALQHAVKLSDRIEVIEDAFVLDLLLNGRQVCGARVSLADEHGVEQVGEIAARAVVLASGGVGQVFASTTNPSVATGDGIAAALRAGAAVADAEFVQFHPTVLWQGPDAEGQQLLVSEAVRGEGAMLFDMSGRRVMQGVHPLEDLAPRDVVAKAISIRMAETGTDHVLLDATSIGVEKLERRFPNIVARCRERGIDPAVDRIPVSPGEHFFCGGVWTDRNGRTSIPGLFAVGETACTGIHGANRLASNSLLEGIVFGDRVGSQLVLNLAASVEPLGELRRPGLVSGRDELAQAMSRWVAVRRDRAGLEEALAALAAAPMSETMSRTTWEATNVQLVAMAITRGALAREESRGCHWRADFEPTSDDWRRRIVQELSIGGFTQRFAGLEDTP